MVRLEYVGCSVHPLPCWKKVMTHCSKGIGNQKIILFFDSVNIFFLIALISDFGHGSFKIFVRR